MVRGRLEEVEKSEEAIERGLTRSVLEEVEGRRILRIRWVTGKTSAGRLFGRYGREGRPDFFRLLFGAIAGSLREHLGDKAEEEFNRLRESRAFKESVSELFEEFKSWFFNEIVPKYGIEPGDIFVISTELEVDLDEGKITWNREKTDVIYWVRSDKLPEKCRHVCSEVEDVQKLRKELEEKEKEIERLREENERLRRELEELRKELESARSKTRKK